MRLRAELTVEDCDWPSCAQKARLVVQDLEAGTEHEALRIYPDLVFESKFDWIVERLKEMIIARAKEAK